MNARHEQIVNHNQRGPLLKEAFYDILITRTHMDERIRRIGEFTMYIFGEKTTGRAAANREGEFYTLVLQDRLLAMAALTNQEIYAAVVPESTWEMRWGACGNTPQQQQFLDAVLRQAYMLEMSQDNPGPEQERLLDYAVSREINLSLSDEHGRPYGFHNSLYLFDPHDMRGGKQPSVMAMKRNFGVGDGDQELTIVPVDHHLSQNLGGSILNYK